MNATLPRTVAAGLLLLAGCQTPRWDAGFFKNPKAKQANLSDVSQLPVASSSTVQANPSAGLPNETQMAGAGADQSIRGAIHENLQAGIQAEQIGQLEQARMYYQQVVRLDSRNVTARHRMAVIADQQHQYEDAERHYLMALEAEPNNVNLLSDLGYSYLLQEKYDQAERFLHEALRVDPRHAQAANNLVLLYGKNGDYSRALAIAQRNATPDEARAKVAQMFPQLAAQYQQAPPANQAMPQNAMPQNSAPLTGPPGISQQTLELRELMTQAKNSSAARNGGPSPGMNTPGMSAPYGNPDPGAVASSRYSANDPRGGQPMGNPYADPNTGSQFASGQPGSPAAMAGQSPSQFGSPYGSAPPAYGQPPQTDHQAAQYQQYQTGGDYQTTGFAAGNAANGNTATGNMGGGGRPLLDPHQFTSLVSPSERGNNQQLSANNPPVYRAPSGQMPAPRDTSPYGPDLVNSNRAAQPYGSDTVAAPAQPSFAAAGTFSPTSDAQRVDTQTGNVATRDDNSPPEIVPQITPGVSSAVATNPLAATGRSGSPHSASPLANMPEWPASNQYSSGSRPVASAPATQFPPDVSRSEIRPASSQERFSDDRRPAGQRDVEQWPHAPRNLMMPSSSNGQTLSDQEIQQAAFTQAKPARMPSEEGALLQQLDPAARAAMLAGMSAGPGQPFPIVTPANSAAGSMLQPGASSHPGTGSRPNGSQYPDPSRQFHATQPTERELIAPGMFVPEDARSSATWNNDNQTAGSPVAVSGVDQVSGAQPYRQGMSGTAGMGNSGNSRSNVSAGSWGGNPGQSHRSGDPLKEYEDSIRQQNAEYQRLLQTLRAAELPQSTAQRQIPSGNGLQANPNGAGTDGTWNQSNSAAGYPQTTPFPAGNRGYGR